MVPSQKFVNIIIRNRRNSQLYQVSQIVPASSSGLMGVLVNLIIRNLRNIQLYQVSQIVPASSSGLMGVLLYKIRCSNPYGSVVYFPTHTLSTHEFVKNSKNLKTSKNLGGFQNFQKIELKISSIQSIRIIRQNSLIRIIRIIGQRINTKDSPRESCIS